MERNKSETHVLLHGVEHLYSKILLRNRVERSSGVGVDPYTQYKTASDQPCLAKLRFREFTLSNRYIFVLPLCAFLKSTK